MPFSKIGQLDKCFKIHKLFCKPDFPVKCLQVLFFLPASNRPLFTIPQQTTKNVHRERREQKRGEINTNTDGKKFDAESIDVPIHLGVEKKNWKLLLELRQACHLGRSFHSLPLLSSLTLLPLSGYRNLLHSKVLTIFWLSSTFAIILKSGVDSIQVLFTHFLQRPEEKRLYIYVDFCTSHIQCKQRMGFDLF